MARATFGIKGHRPFVGLGERPAVRAMNSMLRRSERVALSGLFVLGVTHAASAQQPADRALGAAPAVAIVNVNLIRMDRDRLEPGQTVVVQGDRIVAISAA